ncbi:DUF6931 family protein [Pantoea agglomerans]|uniref:DUF6931 family protein n=1 Tax=Enterobacter agglomerans TaxID=549 RepID=UPI0024131137|nr:hypothetical protein [Pantoea agglomerans]
MTVTKIMSPEGIAEIRDSVSWQENMRTLLTPARWEDALAYWINACTPEEIITWLLPHVCRTLPQNESTCAFEADIRHWLKTHEDNCRWRIFHQAEMLGFATPSGALGLSVFWTGSLTQPEYEAVYAEKHLCPLMLCAALRLLSIRLAGALPPYSGAQQLYSQWCLAQEGE